MHLANETKFKGRSKYPANERIFFFFKSEGSRGAWVPQSVKRPARDFNSGHDLMVPGIELHIGLCTDSISVEPAWNPLSSSFSASPQLVLTLALALSK